MKKLLALFTLLFTSAIMLSACSSSPSVSGEFKRSEYTVSIGDTKDFYDELTIIKGANISDIEFVSSNSEVLQKQEDGFLALSSGKSIIFAKYNDRVFAKTNVIVKYQFSTPLQPTCDENGLMSWDYSYAFTDGTFTDGNTIYAQNYILKIANITGLETIVESDLVFDEKTINGNSFQLEEEGSYYVKLMAMGEGEYIDASQESQGYIVNYGVMGLLENVSIDNNQLIRDERATISWTAKTDALYDVYLDGLKVYSDLEQNQLGLDYFEYDFVNVANGQSVEARVIAKDKNGKKLSSASLLSIEKLACTEIAYVSEEDSHLTFSEIENASSYLAYLQNIAQETYQYQTIEKGQENKIFLEGLESGLYSLEVISVGGNGDKLYLNSKSTDMEYIAKLSIPIVDITFTGNTAEIVFAEDSYNNRYLVTYGKESLIIEGDRYEIDLSDLTVGDYTFAIKAIPTLSNGEIVAFTDGTRSTQNIISSDSYTFDFKILNEIEEVTHRYNKDNHLSTFTFNQVFDANYYNLYINGVLVEDTVVSSNLGFVNLSITNLHEFAPLDNKYIIKIEAGRIENETEVAPLVSIEKTLSVLGLVTKAEEQTNGYYSWNTLNNEYAMYYYDIYQADKDYTITNSTPIVSAGTTEGQTLEALEFGYYVIRIRSTSLNSNDYLDSDFYSESNYFEDRFLVYEQIEMPTVTFTDEGGYQLIIDCPQYAGGFDVYIDGSLEKSIYYNGNSGQAICEIENSFAVADTYEIEVIANVGQSEDGNLHTDSQPFALTVTRLPQPEFTVTERTDSYGLKSAEEFAVTMIENASYPVIMLEGEVVNLDNQQSINIIDQSVYDNEFILSIYFKAGQRQGNDYYIDGLQRDINFRRLAVPTNINYNDGLLSWNNADVNVEGYYLTLITKHQTNGDGYFRRYINTNQLNLDLQTYINNLCLSDDFFNGAYSQAESIEVRLSAFKNSFADGIYILPSADGTTISGQTSLTLYKLGAPTVTFNPDTLVISWNDVAQGTTYDLYIGDILAKEDYTSTSIALSNLSEFDFTDNQQVYVKSKNVNYLTSENSNIIKIKQLASIQSISISNNADGEAVVSFTLSSDITNTEGVLVNNSSENVNYTSASQNGSFLLSNFATTSFTFQVLAQNNSQTQFYFDSAITTFELVDLDSMAFNVALAGDIISWNNIASDFIGNNIFPVTYSLTIANGESTYLITTTDTSYDIQDIEAKIEAVLEGDVSITVEAKVDHAYTLTLANGLAKGYYGEKTGQLQQTQKLLPVGEISYIVNDNDAHTTEMENKLNSYLLITFDDRWSTFSGVYFEVSITNNNEQNSIFITSSSADYSISNIDGQYNLRLNKNLLGKGSSDISIKVHCTGYITSQSNEITINRYLTVEDISVSQDGVLTITSQQTSSYLIEISINDRLVSEKLIYQGEDNKVIDLMQEGLLQDRYGYYTISVIAYDENRAILPSSNLLSITGTKLQGIREIDIADNGRVEISLYPDNFTDLLFIFKVDYLGREYRISASPSEEGSTSNFTMLLIDLLSSIGQYLPLLEARYEFEVAVTKEGCIRSDFVPFAFDYTIDSTPNRTRADMAHDYFLFDIPAEDDTLGVVMKINLYDDSQQAYLFQGNTFFSAEELRGYWCVNNDDGTSYFSKTYDASLTNVTQTECYAVSINDLLAEYQYGRFYIEIARVGRGEVFNQYSLQGYELLKLNKVNDDTTTSNYLQIEGNSLVWQWNAEQSMAGLSQYTPTAYYITFTSAENNDSQSYSLLSYASAFDLRQANLTPGKTYNITVKAVSSSLQVIASEETENQTQALKYTQPLPLDVENGKIVFERGAFANTQFMQTISDYFANTTHDELLYNLMGDVIYTSPFYFHTSTIEQQTLTLRFTALDSSTGAETNTYYEVTIYGYQLLPDIVINNNSTVLTQPQASYFDLLEAYASTIQNLSTSNATYFKNMVQTLSESNKGISGDSLLFDDFGNIIPSGEYALSVYHKGSLRRYIDSDISSSTTIYITASPSLSLSSEVEGDHNNYFATLGNAQTYINNEGASYSYQYVTHYAMIMRFNYTVINGTIYADKTLRFDLVYSDGTGWEIYDSNSNFLEGVVSDQSSTAEVPGFKINLTVLRLAYDSLNVEPIDVNTLMRVDIYALSEDDGYVPNGKSAVFNLRYLDLPADSVSFQNGQMLVTTSLNDNNYILMRYLAVGSGVAQRTIQINNGIAYIDLPRVGAYEYIVLSVNGSISYNTINVESKTYAIENLYKLNQPALSTSDNNLYITYNNADFNYTQDQSLQFLLANNISRQQGDGYYYENILRRGTNSFITYRVGSIDVESGEISYPSELIADTFFTYLLGNSGQIVASESIGQTSHGADYIWTFYVENENTGLTPATMLFSSEESQISARMLNIIDGLPYIDQGNIKWDIVQNPDNIEQGSILYQVTVNYYNQVIGENELDTSYSYIDREIYYTVNNFLSADHISQDYDYYSVEVVALAGQASDDVRSITTLENESYLIADSVYYSDQTTHILRGASLQLGSSNQPITRTSAPILSPNENINNNGVAEGKIIYYISTASYGGEVITDENNQSASSRTLIRANYIQNGRTQSIELTGSYEYSVSSSSYTAGYVLVAFTLDEGQLNNINPFNITVQIYTENGLISKSLEINSVYKMTSLDGNYQITLNGEQTILDFSSYFRYVTIAGDNSFYEIAIEYTTGAGTFTTLLDRNSSSKTFTITNDMTELRIQVRDGQEASTVNRLLILYSDTLHFNIANTMISENGEALVDIIWDSENYMFAWEWNNGNNINDFEYYIEVTTDNLYTITTSTTDNFYMPQERGMITSFSLKARRTAQITAETLYLYSDSIQFNMPEGGIEFDLFSGGNGSESDPYRIADAEDFYNIARRNRLQQAFYFILTSDIILEQDRLIVDDALFISQFYGSLDGDGYSITLQISDLIAMNETYSTSVPGLSGLYFTKYFALFESLSPSAIVKDLELNMELNITSLDGSDVLISPLALYNYGQIDNVTTRTMTITSLQGTGYSNDIFVGGIVSINYGQITNCNNYADLSYNMPQVNINFVYGGIALVNSSRDGYNGLIENCFNYGDVALQVRQSNINVYASGIVIVNNSTLNKVGNEGNFTLTSTVGCAVYFTGVATISSNGSLSYCYNNGTFTKPEIASIAQYFAGIVYSLSSGTINYLVDTAGNALVVTTPVPPSADLGTNYASVGSGTATVISTAPITATTISCGDGYYLRIQSVENGYTASISR